MYKRPYADADTIRISKTRFINEPYPMRPHVVILGSGASRQAFLNGDANTKILPVMDDLIKVTGLQSVFDTCGVTCGSDNFEVCYSRLFEANPKSDILKVIEEKVEDYFTSLELPNKPTLYDHLLLCLRPKDTVATFNWDPLLFDAWERNKYDVPLPEIIHLHGNVRIGYCRNLHCQGRNGLYCPECQEKLTPSRLLYPIEKDYDDPFIHGEWERLEHALSNAFTMTIFGYGAPSTDKKAVELMKKAWKAKSKRELEMAEFIDIKEKDIITEQWSHFIFHSHYMYHNDFYESYIPHYPRRSCEALYVPTFLGKLAEHYPLPTHLGFDDLYSWLKPLIEAEDKLNKKDV